jgi:hypothetical protein
MALRSKVAKLETARKIERVERMVRDLQATVEKKEQKMEKKDLEQKIERIQAHAQAALEKKDVEQKMERMQAQAQATLEKKDLEQKMERMQAQAALEKKDLEQKMERLHVQLERTQAQAQAALEKKDLEQKMEKNEQQIKRMEADGIMRSQNEKRDRLLESEKRDRLLENEKMQAALEKMNLDLAKKDQQQMTNVAVTAEIEKVSRNIQDMELRHQLKQEQKDRKVQRQLQELQRLIESQHMHSNVQQRPLALQSSAAGNMQQRARQAEMDAAAAVTQAQLTRREADRQNEMEEQMIRARAEGAARTKTPTSPPVHKQQQQIRASTSQEAVLPEANKHEAPVRSVVARNSNSSGTKHFPPCQWWQRALLSLLATA